MTQTHLTQTDWNIRLYLYEMLVNTGSAPSHDAIAKKFDIPIGEAKQALHRLNDAHLIFLRPDTDDLMMAFPLSAVKTDYQVRLNGVDIYANCAWDSLGIPAMVKQDAQITISHPTTREAINYAVVDGTLQGEGFVHIAKPFAEWYDDLIDT